MTYRCTSKNFPSSHGRQRRWFREWKVASHRIQAAVEPKQKIKRVQKSTIYSRGNYFLCNERAEKEKHLNKLFNCIESVSRRKENYLKLLCVAKAGLDNLLIWWPIRPRPMSCSRTETRRQMLSSVLLSSIMLGFNSPMKCGMEKSVEPMPIITAPVK